MTNFLPQVKELIITPEKAASFCNFFQVLPERQKLKNFGYLFGLVEYEDDSKEILELTEKLLQDLENNYYLQDNEDGENTKNSEYFEKRLERALRKTNTNFLQLVNSQNTNLDLAKLNIILVLIKAKDIYLTTVGKINAFLIHPTSRLDFKIINILDNTVGEEGETKTDPLKIFSQIISGKISLQDFLFLCTDSVLDYLSLEKIKNLVAYNSPEDAIEEFRKLLEEVNTNYSLGLAIAKQEPIGYDESEIIIKKMEKFEYTKAASDDSMNELIKTQQATQKILNTSYLPDLKKYSILLKKSLQQYLNKAKNVPLPKIPSIKRPELLEKIREPVREKGGGSALKTRISNFSAPIKNIKLFSRLKLALSTFKDLINNTFKDFSLKSRLLLLASIVLIVIFLGNLFYQNIKNTKEENQKILQDTIMQVQEKKDAAQASLIYEDETKARRLLLEAKDLLNNLSKQNKKEAVVKNLNDEIELQLSKLRHMVELEDPVMLANFANVNQSASVAPLLVLLGGKIYSQDHNNQAIYILDTETRNISTIFQATVKIKNASAATAFSNSDIIFLNEDKSVFELETANDSIDLLELNLPADSQINTFNIYNQRLYFLDKKNNQIYRFRRLGQAFGSPTNWLREKIDLSQVTSFAIDGQIYLLKNNGQILKLLNGLKTDFEISDIDPKLESPSKLHTFIDSNYLYILDPPTKRLVVLDKEGKLIIQYHSEEFDNLKDFVVDESDSKIYILNGNKIFGIPANHLE